MASNSGDTIVGEVAWDPLDFVSTRASMRQIAKRIESAATPSYQDLTAEAANEEMKNEILPPKRGPKRAAKPKASKTASQAKVPTKQFTKSTPEKRKRGDGNSTVQAKTPRKRTKTTADASENDLPRTPDSLPKTTLSKRQNGGVDKGDVQSHEHSQQDQIVDSAEQLVPSDGDTTTIDDDSSSSLTSAPSSTALEALRAVNNAPVPENSVLMVGTDASTSQSDEIAVSHGRIGEAESPDDQETLIVKLSIPSYRNATDNVQSITQSSSTAFERTLHPATDALHQSPGQPDDHQTSTLEESVPTTPVPRIFEAWTALQLPTPPSSVDSSTDRPVAESRPKRKSNAPERYGGLKETVTAVESTVAEPNSDTDVGRNEANEMDTTDQMEYKPTSAKASTQRKTPSTATKMKVAPMKVAKGRVARPSPTKGASTRKTKADKDFGETTKTLATSPLASRKSKSSLSVKAAQKHTKRDGRVEGSSVRSGQSPWEQFVVDQAVRNILDKLTKTMSVAEKPSPKGKPAVWAESRQALCETLPYFKRPQGGCYQNEGHVYGFLFDGLGHCREYMDEDVIICRAGGSMESDSNGGMSQGKNQTFKEAQVQAVLNDIKHQNPCVVICGDKNEAAPCRMPHQYCVLGWYKPVMAWSEKTQGKGKKTFTTVKYRLERLNRHKPVWHSPGQDARLGEVERAAVGPLREETCSSCNRIYPQVYLRGWICLNVDCNNFWKFEGVEIPCGKQYLEYNPAFLLYQSKLWKSDDEADEPEPSPLRPPVPNVGNVIGDNLTYINTRGICCPRCGRCNSRRFFRGWECENAACDSRSDEKLFPKHRPIPLAMLHTPWDSAPTLIRNAAPTLERADDQPGVNLKVRYRHGYKIATYTFDGIDGCFVHAAATKPVVQEEDIGPDAMFEALQTEDMGLERRTFATKKASTGQTEQDTSKAKLQPEASGLPTPPEELEAFTTTLDKADDPEEEAPKAKHEFEDGDLMTAFSMNYGMPYKFVASGASQPFDGAPWPITQTRRVLNWAQTAFLEKDAYEDLNEELVFAYLQGQKIEYHDDGEQGLGPRIATLSLGGRAKMHMRLKQKHYVGCSKTGIFTEECPVPGGLGGTDMDARRLEKWEEIQTLKTNNDMPGYRQRRKEVPQELKLVEKRMKKAPDLVTVTLSHGDIVLMEGYDIQKYLEHKVVPEGYFRFALTCRTVLESHLREDERPGYEVAEDTVKYLGPNLGVNGVALGG